MQIDAKKGPAKRPPPGLRWQGMIEKGATSSALDFRLGQQERFVAPQDPDKGNKRETIWWSALLDLRDTSIAAFVNRLDADLRRQIHIPTDYTPEDQEVTFEDKLVVVFATTDLLATLNLAGKELNVASVILGAIINPNFINLKAQGQIAALPIINVPNGTVISAVIDDGIAFANDVFRDGLTSTRVQYATDAAG